MRDLLFRNLTSTDRKRKILASSEIFDKAGVRTVVRRHFVYIVKEMPLNTKVEKHPVYLAIVKEKNTKEKQEKFFCKMKNGIYVVAEDKIYFIIFMHSLKICLSAIPKNLKEYT